MTPSPPSVLLVEDESAPMAGARALRAALLVEGAHVDRIVTRLGGKGLGALLDRGGKIVRELAELRPQVVVVTEPRGARAATETRDRAMGTAVAGAGDKVPVPVVAWVPELSPGADWAVDADRWVVMDEQAAAALVAFGCDGARILVLPPPLPVHWVEAGRKERSAVRRGFGIDPDEPVVLLDLTRTAESDLRTLCALLNLVSTRCTFLLSVGDDIGKAEMFRRDVPRFGLRAKMLGRTPQEPLAWRAADVVVASPVAGAIHAALGMGTAFLASWFVAGGPEAREARAVETRGLGSSTSGGPSLPAAIDALLRDKSALARIHERARARGTGDGAALFAQGVVAMAFSRAEVLAETFAVAEARRQEPAQRSFAGNSGDASASRTERPAPAAPRAAGDLEDLGGDEGGSDSSARASRRASSAGAAPSDDSPWDERERRATRAVAEARAGVEEWDTRRRLAEDKGEISMARDAAREADRKRARMHEALAELARATEERARRPAAPPPPRSAESELDALRERARTQVRSVDEELADLKRRAGVPPRRRKDKP